MSTMKVLPAATRLDVEFDAIYTAEDAGSYKPSDRNFEYMLDKLKTTRRWKG